MMLFTVPSWLVTIGWEETDRQKSQCGRSLEVSLEDPAALLEGLISWLAHLLISVKDASRPTRSAAI